MKPINETIHNYYEFLCSKYGSDHILGVFLYGSQNYNIATEESDVDVKAIYVPSLLEIGGNEHPISKELIWEETGAHIEVKDIRLMTEMWKKMNINFLEIMFTPFLVINPRYVQLWSKIVSKKEDIARYNKYLAIKSTYFQAKNTAKGSTVTSKQYVNVIRLCQYLYRYTMGEPYLRCITVSPSTAEEMKKEKLSKKEHPREDLFYQLGRLEDFNEYAEHNKHILQVKKSKIDDFLAQWCAEAILMASPIKLSID